MRSLIFYLCFCLLPVRLLAEQIEPAKILSINDETGDIKVKADVNDIILTCRTLARSNFTVGETVQLEFAEHNGKFTPASLQLNGQAAPVIYWEFPNQLVRARVSHGPGEDDKERITLHADLGWEHDFFYVIVPVDGDFEEFSTVRSGDLLETFIFPGEPGTVSCGEKLFRIIATQF